MDLLVYTPHEGSLQKVTAELTPDSTTYFNSAVETGDVYWIADSDGGLLIKTLDYNCPLLLQGLSRRKILYSKKKALELYRRETI